MLRTALMLLAALVIAVPATGQEVGRLYFITGCDPDGGPPVALVNIWSTAEGGRILGKLSGVGRPDTVGRCSGSVVIVRAVRVVGARRRVRVESVVNGTKGWVTDFFIGRPFDRDCEAYFQEVPEAVRRCEGAKAGRPL